MASKSRRNKATFKWTKELIFLISFLAVLIIVTIVLAIPSSAKRTLNKYNEAITTYNSENSTSYSTLAADNVFEEIGGGYDQQVNNVMNLAKGNEYVYVFYGALTDQIFLEQLSNINTLAKEYEVKKVYVFLANYVTDAEKNEETSTISFKQKVDEVQKLMYEYTGDKVKSFRFQNVKSIAPDVFNEIKDYLNKNNYAYYDYDIDTNDLFFNKDEIINSVIKDILSSDNNQITVLMHDCNLEQTIDSLPTIIGLFKDMNYEFDTISSIQFR